MKKYKNIVVNVFYIVLGIVLLVLSVMGKINNIFCGFGGGLIGIGALQLARAVKYHTNDEYKEMVNTEKNDERNRYISLKAWSWAGYSFVIICAVLALVFMIMNKIIYVQIASGAICLVILLYYFSYLVIRKKY